MTDKPATFAACYADWKLIKTRRCVQIVLEVPLEAADEAYSALGGMPNAATERWVAVARLDMNAVKQGAQKSPSATPEPSPRQQTGAASKYNLAQRAGMLCAQPSFRLFLGVESEDEAAAKVRGICHVKSRSEIIPNTSAGYSFETLLNEYVGWQADLD